MVNDIFGKQSRQALFNATWALHFRFRFIPNTSSLLFPATHRNPGEALVRPLLVGIQKSFPLRSCHFSMVIDVYFSLLFIYPVPLFNLVIVDYLFFFLSIMPYKPFRRWKVQKVHMVSPSPSSSLRVCTTIHVFRSFLPISSYWNHRILSVVFIETLWNPPNGLLYAISVWPRGPPGWSIHQCDR